MAATGATAEVFLGMNVKKFIAGAKQGITASKDMVDKLKAHQGQMRSISLKAGIALGAQALWIKKVTDASGKQELAQVKLTAALKNVKGAREGDADALIKQSAALQQLTSFGDEEIINAQAMLATFQLTGDQIAAITPRLLDMAAGTEKLTGQQVDLQTIAIALGKGFTGQAGQLARYGVVLSDATKESGDFNAILKDLDANFKGLAAASAATFLGQQKQLKNAISDLNEKIGAALIPTLISLFDRIKPIIERSAAWIAENQKLVAMIIGGGVGGTGLIFALSSMGFLLAGLPALFAALATPIGAVIAVAVALAAAFALIESKSGRAKTEIDKFRESQAKAQNTIEANNETLKGNATEAEQLKKEIERLTAKVAEGGIESVTYTRILNDTETKLAELEAQTKTLREENERLLKSQRDLTEQDVLTAIQANLDKQEELKQKIIDINIEMKKNPARDFQAAWKPALEFATKSLEETEDAAEALNKDLEEVRARMAGIKTESTVAPPSTTTPTAPGPAVSTIIPEEIAPREEETTYWDYLAEKAELYGDVVEETNLRIGESFQAQQDMALAAADTFFGSMEAMYNEMGGKLGKAILGSTINALKAVIDAWRIAEVTKATASAPLSFGATLAAIGPIIAAASAGKALLSALMGQVKSFELGGVIRETGLAFVHKGERVINPARPESFKNAGMAGATGGNMYVMPAFYGPINHKVDIADASKELGLRLRLAINAGM